MSELFKALRTAQPLPRVERVTLVGGPCDGQRLFIPVGSSCALYVGLRVAPLKGRRRRGWSFAEMFERPEPWEQEAVGAQGHTKDKVMLAVYSPRQEASGLWVPYLGFDGITEIPAEAGDGPFPPQSHIHDEPEEDDDA